METLSGPSRRQLSCSRDFLKWMAFVCLCLGTFSVGVVQRAMIHLDQQTPQSLYEAMLPGGNLMGTVSLAAVTTLLSTLAIPLYAFLTVESYQNTMDERKYLLRVVALALISEVPYDLAVFGRAWDFAAQNPALGLMFAVIMLEILSQISRTGFAGGLMRGTVILAACLWAAMLGCQNGVVTVLLTAVFYLLQEKPTAAKWVGAGVSLLAIPAPVSVLFIHLYDGKEQKTPRWVFYILYPLHFLILALVAWKIQ